MRHRAILGLLTAASLVLATPAGATPLLLAAATASPEDDWSDLALPSDPEAAQKLELGARREVMSGHHVTLGMSTLGLLGAAGVAGALLVRENDPTVRLAHQGLILAGTLSYLTGGTLMWLAPRPYQSQDTGHLGNIDVHRMLTYLHVAGMTAAVATGLITTRAWSLDPSLAIARSHPALGALSIGVIAASATVMFLNF